MDEHERQIREHLAAYRNEINLEDLGGAKQWGPEAFILRAKVAVLVYDWAGLTGLGKLIPTLMKLFPEYANYHDLVRAQYSPAGVDIAAKLKMYLGPNGYAMFKATLAKVKMDD